MSSENKVQLKPFRTVDDCNFISRTGSTYCGRFYPSQQRQMSYFMVAGPRARSKPSTFLSKSKDKKSEDARAKINAQAEADKAQTNQQIRNALVQQNQRERQRWIAAKNLKSEVLYRMIEAHPERRATLEGTVPVPRPKGNHEAKPKTEGKGMVTDLREKWEEQMKISSDETERDTAMEAPKEAWWL